MKQLHSTEKSAERKATAARVGWKADQKLETEEKIK